MPASPPEDVFSRLAQLAQQTGPLLLVLVGPNGAGKRTFHKRNLSAIPLPFINADVLAQTLIQAGAPTGETTERLAAQLAEKKVGPTQVRFPVSRPASRPNRSLTLLPNQLRDGAHGQKTRFGSLPNWANPNFR